MRDFIIVSEDIIDSLRLRNAFLTRDTVEERRHEMCKKRLMFRQLKLIANKFLLFRERTMLYVYMFHNNYRRELMMFVDTHDQYYITDVMKKVLRLLKKFVSFFLENDYKRIDVLCKKTLTEKEYMLIRQYLRLHTYRRVGFIYGVTEEAIRIRLKKIVGKIEKYPEVEPLLDLIRFLQNYRYTKRNG